MNLVRVSDVSLGQVISSDDDGIGPALVEAMTSGTERQLQLRDIDSGERLEKIQRFRADQLVMVHDVPLEYHIYTNTTAESVEVHLGPETLTVAPGESVRHLGRPRPDVFPPDAWSQRPS